MGGKRIVTSKGGEYRDQYFDRYCEYLTERKNQERKAEGKKPYSESTIRTIATDTFYLEKHNERNFGEWLKSDKTLEEARTHLLRSLSGRDNPEKDADWYLDCMSLFRDFLNSGKRVQSSNREFREWIIPCNVEYYDIDNALRDLKIIDWRQTTQLNNAQVGDIVYFYCKNKKQGAIWYKGAILAVNKTENHIDDSKYAKNGSDTVGPFIELAVFRVYELSNELTYSKLKEHGLASRLQGPTVIKGSVADYLHECDFRQAQYDRFSGDIADVCLFPFPIQARDIRVKPKVEALDDTYSDTEKEEHAAKMSLEDLKIIAAKQSKDKPKEVTTTVKQVARDPYIAEYARRRANGICQLCGQKAPFNRADGEPYLESHHIEWLSNGGADSIENTVALCPNCHRRMHIVKDKNDVKKLKESNKKLK